MNSLIKVGLIQDHELVNEMNQILDADDIFSPLVHGPAALFQALYVNAPGESAGDPLLVFPPMSTSNRVLDNEGVLREVPAGAIVREGYRVVRNLATALSTHSINVVNGAEYFVTIAGEIGASVTCSNAFTGTITIPASGRYTLGKQTATSTTLLLTVTGSLSELQVEHATSDNPSEYIDFAATHLTSNAAGIAYFTTDNGNTFNVSTGLVTQALGAALDLISAGVLLEGVGGNLLGTLSDYSTNFNKTGLVSALLVPSQTHKYAGLSGTEIVEDSAPGLHRTRSSTKTIVEDAIVTCTANVKPNAGGRDFVISLAANPPTSYFSGFYNLTTGEVLSSAGAGTYTIEDVSITALPDGSFDCLLAGTTVGTQVACYLGLSNGASNNYTGDGVSSLLLTAVQLEESPVPTTKTALTSRSATNDVKVTLADIGFDGTASGSCSLDISFKHDFADLPATDMSILSLAGEVGAALLYHKANHTLAMFDGTTSVEASTTIVADTTYGVLLTWEVGSNMTIYVDDVQVGQAAWDDDWDDTTVLAICKGYTFGAVVSNLKILDGVA